MNAEKVIEKILYWIADLFEFLIDMVFVGVPVYFIPRVLKSIRILDEINNFKSACTEVVFMMLIGMLIFNSYRICKKWFEKQGWGKDGKTNI